MFSYTKALIALGVALAGVLAAWFWFSDRSGALDSMLAEKAKMRLQIADAASYGPIIHNLQTRVKGLDQERNDLQKGLVAVNLEGPRLVQSVVDSAALCGIKMTGADEASGREKGRRADVAGLSLNVVTYRVSLKGSYAGMVKFMQMTGAWPFRNRIESLEIVAQGERASEEEVEMILIMSVFSNAR